MENIIVFIYFYYGVERARRILDCRVENNETGKKG